MWFSPYNTPLARLLETSTAIAPSPIFHSTKPKILSESKSRLDIIIIKPLTISSLISLFRFRLFVFKVYFFLIFIISIYCHWNSCCWINTYFWCRSQLIFTFYWKRFSLRMCICVGPNAWECCPTGRVEFILRLIL